MNTRSALPNAAAVDLPRYDFILSITKLTDKGGLL